MSTSASKLVAPSPGASSFHCPHCGVLAEQRWERPVAGFGEKAAHIERPHTSDQRGAVIWRVARCQHCRDFTLWVNDRLVHPDESSVEDPNSDLSEAIQRDYREAASILGRSPRGAAALLRLALEKLCGELNAEGDDLNAQIRDLVGRGLPAAIQKSLDAVRVTGNEAVHPGLMDIADDEDTCANPVPSPQHHCSTHDQRSQDDRRGVRKAARKQATSDRAPGHGGGRSGLGAADVRQHARLLTVC